MENLQFKEAFEILSNYYGYPNWENNPKEGQKRDDIIDSWSKELSSYTVSDIKNACFWLVKKKKTMTFPSLSVLLNELFLTKKDERIAQTDALIMYNFLMNNKNEKLSHDLNKLSSQRAIYRIYEVEVDGYCHKEDTGYQSGSIPEYVKNESSFVLKRAA